MALASAAPLQLGMPEVHFGLIPAWGAIAKIPRIVGPDDGLNLLITGRTIGYLLARSLGIVDRLASDNDSIESLNLLSSPGETERTWPKDAWEEAWNQRGKRSTNGRVSTPRLNCRSSPLSQSTLHMVATQPARPLSKPWLSRPCQTSCAIIRRRFSIAGRPAGVSSVVVDADQLSLAHEPRSEDEFPGRRTLRGTRKDRSDLSRSHSFRVQSEPG